MQRFESKIVHASKPRLSKKHIQKAPLSPLLPEAGITVAKLFEVARTCGVAKSMPGYLRDMLAQPTLPASTVRINRTLLKPPAPVSANHGKRNKTASDKAMELVRENGANDCIDILSGCGHIPDAVWSEWRSASERCVRQILSLKRRTVKRWQESVIKTIESSPHIGVNSWCAWTLQYLATEGYDKGWQPSTFYRYLKQLLPVALSEHTAAVDVEYFDEEDLGLLIDAISAKGNTAETVKGHVSLICRMVEYAQLLQPELAFPEVEVTVKDKAQQLNKRAHILAPSEMEVLVEREIDEGKIQEALVLALIGFTGMRPIEIMYLDKRDITLLPDALEINIRRSKTPAGCRSLPVHALVPTSVHGFLHKIFRELVDDAGDDGRLFKEGEGRAARRVVLIDPALVRLRATFGGGIDLYTLRHSFASWAFVRLYMAAYPDYKAPEYYPSLRHSLFNPQLEDFAKLVYHQRPYQYDPDAMYRLSKLMGHATPETLPRTYLHSAGLVHASFLADCAGTGSGL